MARIVGGVVEGIGLGEPDTEQDEDPDQGGGDRRAHPALNRAQAALAAGNGWISIRFHHRCPLSLLGS